MTEKVGSVTLIQSADSSSSAKKTPKKSTKSKSNSVWTDKRAVAKPKVTTTTTSSGCGFWGKLGNGLKSLACGFGNLLAGGIKAFGGLLGMGGKMIGGLGAALGSSNLGFGLGVGLGMYGIYNSIGNGGYFGIGAMGCGWPFMTTSGFYRPLCSGIGGWRAPAFIAGGFPNLLSCNGFGAANLLGFDFNAFGNCGIRGAHASLNPLQHYWSCGSGGKPVFGFR